MEHSALLQLGVGGIFAILIIREVLSFLKTRNGKDGHTAEKLIRDVAALRAESRDMHEWHKPNSDGQQTWKNYELIEAVRDMKTAVENNTKMAGRFLPILERMEHSQK